MARRLKTPCNFPQCPELVDGRYCQKHKTQRFREDAARRGSAAQRGYDRRWRRIREIFLKEHPLCEHCQREGRTEAATEVDHIDGNVKNMSWSNFQPLCKRHHSIKTARENGSFGNIRKSTKQ